ncbi:MFS transporter [Streptomyces sp. N2-109]|uniref:MFS transporter n=1 Tax=Streptomyces gossypii TaxID=2883101 RepID=A0ABT2K0S2_9ACTN|nr:MFS transporter [Streptomyces gossypii]MCT2593064.1 MFS transporter [Streptomyces gossypii]
MTVLLSSLMFPLTITGASVALPGITGDLGAGLAASQWVVNSYNAAFAGFLVITGALADVHGRRRVFAGGVALFFVGGMTSAFAGDVLLLNTARGVSGAGAAAATTAGASILAATFEGAARGRAFGLLGTVLGVGTAFGPMVSGFLVDALSWRAVFAVPAAVAGLVLLLTPGLPVLPGKRGGGQGQGQAQKRRGHGIDWSGAVLFALPLVLLIFILGEGPVLGFTHPGIVLAVAAIATLGALFVRVERRVSEPMFDLGLVANPRFLSYAVAAGSLMGILVPLLVYLPSYLIDVVGLGAGRAGVWLLMLTMPVVLLPTLGAALAKRLPSVVLVAGSVAVSGVGALLLAVTLGPDSGPGELLASLVLIGTGAGLTMGVLDGLAISSVRAEQAGTAAGLFNTARLATETIALAAVGALLAACSGGELKGAEFTEGMRAAGLALSGFAAVAAAGVIALARKARHANG